MRLGHTEKQVLVAILNIKVGPVKYRSRCSRYRVSPGEVRLIDVRDELYGENPSPAQKAGLSRALRTLEEKGLIRTHYATRTTAELTPEGEQMAEKLNVNYAAQASKLTPTGPGEEAT